MLNFHEIEPSVWGMDELQRDIPRIRNLARANVMPSSDNLSFQDTRTDQAAIGVNL
jgi:hypothetical protein